MTDSGWLQRKAPLRVTRAQEQQRALAEEETADNMAATRDDQGQDDQANEDEGDANEDANDQDDEPAFQWRRRNRLSDMHSEASSSIDDEQQDGGVGDEESDNDREHGGGVTGAIDRLLREDDSGDDGNGSVRGDGSDVDDDNDHDDDAGAFRAQLGLEDDDGWNVFAGRHPGILNLQRFPLFHRHGHEIALHLVNDNAVGGGGGRAGDAVVDLQNTQNDEGQEIDLTALSSDSEEEIIAHGGGGNDEDDDDEVEIVGSNAVGIMRPASPRGGVRRKRRRPNDAAGGEAAAARPFDTQRAESTNVSLENNETIERFKAALKCSVCLEVIEDMTSTICGHVYCAKCIRLAIRVTQKCPLCQRPLRPTDIHGLYF